MAYEAVSGVLGASIPPRRGGEIVLDGVRIRGGVTVLGGSVFGTSIPPRRGGVTILGGDLIRDRATGTTKGYGIGIGLLLGVGLNGVENRCVFQYS